MSEFADWVGRTKRKKVFVTGTHRYPTLDPRLQTLDPKPQTLSFEP